MSQERVMATWFLCPILDTDMAFLCKYSLINNIIIYLWICYHAVGLNEQFWTFKEILSFTVCSYLIFKVADSHSVMMVNWSFLVISTCQNACFLMIHQYITYKTWLWHNVWKGHVAINYTVELHWKERIPESILHSNKSWGVIYRSQTYLHLFGYLAT